MDVSSAYEWWEEWQLRVLVLGSLLVQSILSLFASLRKRAIPSWFRSMMWLTYIGGDALAIYAFATLFSRQKQHTIFDGSRTLELMWAPILLIHLGGQASISAYSLEDSKLWKHHVVVLVSKVTVALYIFIRWWSDSKRLLMVSVGLLILGILKFMEKPWALWIGSYDRLVSAIAKSPPSKKQRRELSLQEYVRQTKKLMREEVVAGVNSDKEETEDENTISLKMLADLPASYSDRLKDLQSFLKLDDSHAYAMLQRCHGDTFRRLYTRNTYSVLATCFKFCVPLVGSFSVGSFFFSNKDGYDANDVTVTYILLCWCAILDLLNTFSTSLMHLTRWHHMVPQYSLMSCCGLRKNPTILMRLAAFKFIQKYLHEHWYAGQAPAAVQITKLVRRQVRDVWNVYIRDVATYRVFSNCRGQWTLYSHVWESDHRQRLGQTFKVPFDESILLWHIATDICFHHTSPEGRQGNPTKRSREISSYMFYLLAIRPEMLMPGTRPGISTAAINYAYRILKYSKEPLENEEMFAREIIHKMKPTARTPIEETCSLLPEACRLAEALMELVDEKERWFLMQGVWVEMLCYSAARCRGYLHAKSLGDGGEYLSYVWLLWAFMGLETLADKIQRPEPPGEEEIIAAGIGFPAQSF